MDPASAILLFVLFQATEKGSQICGRKNRRFDVQADLGGVGGKSQVACRQGRDCQTLAAFSQAYAEAGTKLKAQGRHPELAKQMVEVLAQFDLKALPDNQWLDELAVQLEKASLVSEKPDEFLLVELFARVLSNRNTQTSRAELSETISDFVSIFRMSCLPSPLIKKGCSNAHSGRRCVSHITTRANDIFHKSSNTTRIWISSASLS